MCSLKPFFTQVFTLVLAHEMWFPVPQPGIKGKHLREYSYQIGSVCFLCVTFLCKFVYFEYVPLSLDHILKAVHRLKLHQFDANKKKTFDIFPTFYIVWYHKILFF